MITLNYEYRLTPTAAQAERIDHWLVICRKVYNFALAARKDWVNSRKSPINACSIVKEYIIPADAPRPTFYRQAKELSAAKVAIPELKEPHTHVLQQVLRQLEAAFVAMWDRGHGFPRFKKRMRSFVFPQLNKTVVVGRQVNLPKLGWIKLRKDRQIPGGFEVKQARVIRKASGYYVMLTLQSEVSVPDATPHGEPLGIDVGLEHYLATSTGRLVENPRFFVNGQRKLKSLQRQLKRKRKGSRRYQQIQRKVALHHEYLTNARKDFMFKLAHQLCDNSGMIFAESLNLKALAKGMLGKHCLDAAWGSFLNILEWVCFKRGVYFAKVDANGTSQTCPNCQTVTGKKDLNQRMHVCPECGYAANRDVASALVVMQRGIAAVGHTVKKLNEGEVSRPPTN